jgi:hypothetical protein
MRTHIPVNVIDSICLSPEFTGFFANSIFTAHCQP